MPKFCQCYQVDLNDSEFYFNAQYSRWLLMALQGHCHLGLNVAISAY